MARSRSLPQQPQSFWQRCLGPAASVALSLLLILAFLSPTVKVWFGIGLMALAPREARIAAVGQLGSLGPVAAPAIRIALAQRDAGMRHAALISLQEWAPDGLFLVAPQLCQVFREAGEDLATLEETAAVLMRMGKEAAPFLEIALQSPSERVLCLAMRSLGGLGPQARAALPRLRVLLSDKRGAVREAAAAAITRIRTDSTSAIVDGAS